MPLPKDSKILGQVREGKHLVLYYKTKGKVKRDVRTKCICPVNKNKPCKCKK